MLPKILKDLQNLSIDVALGSVTMSWLFSKANEIQVPLAVYLVLGVAVWLAYTFDHLLDAIKIKNKAKTARHRFHQENFKTLIISWIAILAAGFFIAIVYLPLQTWKWGSAVVFFIIAHFVFVHFFGSVRSKWVLKEVGVAWCYAAGVVVGPLSFLDTLSWMQPLSFLFLFTIAFFNLVMFSFFEYKSDVRQGHASIAINYDKGWIAFIMNSIFFTSLILGTCLLIMGSGNLYFYCLHGHLLFISIFYYMMISLSGHLNRASLYRVLGDGVFIAPSILIVFA